MLPLRLQRRLRQGTIILFCQTGMKSKSQNLDPGKQMLE